MVEQDAAQEDLSWQDCPDCRKGTGCMIHKRPVFMEVHIDVTYNYSPHPDFYYTEIELAEAN